MALACAVGIGMASNVLTATPARSAPPAVDEIEKLLELSWAIAPDARQAGDGLFERLVEATGSDNRVVYAQALGKIKQRKYADASKLVDDLVSAEPQNVEFGRAKVWLAILLRKSEQGLVTLGRLVGQLPKPSDPPADDEARYLDLLRFAGRVHGFLEGPGAEGIPEATLMEHRKKLLERLDEDRKMAFLEGRDAVVDRWLGQKDDEQSTRDKVKRDQEQQRDERLADLDKQREQGERRAAELNSDRTRLRSELNDQLADLQRQERPLIDQLGRLDAQASVSRRELAIVASDINRIEALLLRERDPFVRDQYQRDIGRLDALASRYQANINALVRQGSGLNAQRADLQRRAAQVQQSIGRQLEGVEREQADILKRTRSADSEERRLRKSQLGDSTQLRAMSAQSSAFTTYVAFPLEEERERLLDSLKPRKR